MSHRHYRKSFSLLACSKTRILHDSHIDRSARSRFNASFRREFCRKRSARLCVYCFGIIVGAVRTFRRGACLKRNKRSNHHKSCELADGQLLITNPSVNDLEVDNVHPPTSVNSPRPRTRPVLCQKRFSSKINNRVFRLTC